MNRKRTEDCKGGEEVKKSRWKEEGRLRGCWRARFFCSSPSVGLSCWSVSVARGPWPAAAICSELVLRHHSRPSLLVSPANVWSFKLTFCVHSVYWRLCTDTNLWFFGAGRSCRSGGVGGGAGGRQTHSYFSFFFLGRFSIHLQKNTDFNIKAIKNSAFLPSAEHKSIYSEECWEPVSVPADFQTMQADETPNLFSIQDSSKHLCLPQKKVSLQRHKGE